MKPAFGIAFCTMLATAACAPGKSVAGETMSWADALGAEITDEWSAPEHRAFDFWVGEWEANWRPPAENEFEHAAEGSWTRQRVFPILGGKAIVELAWARDNPEQPSQRGFSIRYYDPARERWVMAQNWPNGNSQGSAFTDQLIGKEHLGRRTMYSATRRPTGDGEFADEHRRYNFTDVQEESFRWDGSNTPDNGKTWSTWYVVDFLRQRDLDPYGAAGTSFPGVHKEALCTDEPHGAFDGLQGVWSTQDGASLAAGKVIDGCGVMAVLNDGKRRTLFLIGYHPRFEHWVIYRLDDKPGTGHSYLVSKQAGEGAVFEEAPALAIKDEFAPYLRPASFETDGARRRLVWETLSDNEIVFREEARRQGRGWETSKSYRFMRR